MKLFQFAVASIVDANTGYGYAHNLDKIDYNAEIQNSRNIRSQSIAVLLRSFGQWIAASVEAYKIQLQQRRNLRRLYQLDDHLLKDIGLTSEDLNSVASGRVSFDQLNAKHPHDLLTEGKRAEVRTIAVGQELPAANQDSFSEIKCA